MSKEKNQFTGPKKYLEKSFLEELNYKIWSTKGARFKADKRLRAKAKLSNITLAIISAYLIIASLISVYSIDNNSNENLINYAITALSILLLVVSQFENSQEYKLNARIFHDCGLELSELYNELRIFKTLKKKPTDYEAYVFSKKLSERYQIVLKNYQNHSSIDYNMFRVSNLDYFDTIATSEIKKIKRKYNWGIYGWYTIMIVIIPIIIIIIKVI
ncbi:SLATT domain-containing protein [uncultured Kordia sp.]|uniref:SLATT domain-containing protein n=1 Tax=uncultured Kordia sp. TaxID=507699 RepID=UPI00260882EF|nr:SLATT domain-containing protein [uncultured Kordia sp.]